MFDKIVFFEYRHYGDIHESRMFVDYIIKNIPAKEYEYVLERNPKVLFDIKGLTFKHITQHNYPISMYCDWKIIDNVFFINTSLGAAEFRFFNNNTIQTAYTLFKELLKEKCGHSLVGEINDFIPTIDFSHYNIKNVDSFMSNYDGKRKVLISNGVTESGQCLNFNMDPVIEKVANSFPDIMFFITNYPKNVLKDNVFYCKDIISQEDDFDLVETTYFSIFCDTIIGRSSGPYILSLVKENVLINPKKYICFCHDTNSVDYGLSPLCPEFAKKIVRSSNYDIGSVSNIILNNL